jgi:hypothetical protein
MIDRLHMRNRRPISRTLRVTRRLVAAGSTAIGLAVVAACGSSKGSPTSPTAPAANVPTIVSPLGDALVDVRPTLTIQNVSGTAGSITYDFQVSTSNEFGSGTISKSGVAAGASGQTSYKVGQDLKTRQRYYWHVRSEIGGAPSAWSPAATFQTLGGPDLGDLKLSSSRAEIGKSITVKVPISSAGAGTITYAWSANGGTFSGTGASVKWTAPKGEPTPATYKLTVKVTQDYTVQTSTGPQTKTTTSTAHANVYVNDSPREIADLVLQFLGRFSNSSIPADVCVSTFSDNCPGKAEEESQIAANRVNYSDIIAEHFDVSSISLNPNLTSAEVEAPCGWTSVYRTPKPDGTTQETVDGTCLLKTVYEDHEWKLCDSNFHATSSSSSLKR